MSKGNFKTDYRFCSDLQVRRARGGRADTSNRQTTFVEPALAAPCQIPQWPNNAHGIFGGSLSLAILFGSRPLTLPLFLIATTVAASYFVAMMFAPAFPGTDRIDPEFKPETGRPLGLAPQQLITYLLCGLVVAAVALAVFS